MKNSGSLSAKLRYRNQQIDAFAAFNAHKLRGPIATILGLYELLELALSANEREMVFEKIKETVLHLDQIVRLSQRILDEPNDKGFMG